MHNTPKKKVCSRCKELKLFHNFRKNRTRADGLQGHCVSCSRDYYELKKQRELESAMAIPMVPR